MKAIARATTCAVLLLSILFPTTASAAGFTPTAYTATCVDGSIGNILGQLNTKSYYRSGTVILEEAQRTLCDARQRSALEKRFSQAHKTLQQHGFSALRDEIRPVVKPKLLGDPSNYLWYYPKEDGIFSLSTLCAKDASVGYFKAGRHFRDLMKKRNTPVFQAFTSHELQHLAQLNLLGNAQSCVAFKEKHKNKRRAQGWWSEGIADAYGVAVLHQRHKKEYFGRPPSDPFHKRLYLHRPYYEPLIHGGWEIEGDSKHKLATLDYRTNGFWEHILRRYLKNQPKRFEGIYKAISPRLVKGNQTAAIDRYLNQLDGRAGNGLKTLFPQFLTEYVSWPRTRFGKKMPMRKWLAESFKGCHRFQLSSLDPAASHDIKIKPYAGACIDVEIDGLASIPSISIAASGKNIKAVDDLYLGLAEILVDYQLQESCFTEVKKNNYAKQKYCLLDPRQGTTNNNQALRSWWVPDSQIPRSFSSGGRTTLRFVLSRVPNKITDWRGTMRRAAKIPLTVALDQATMTPLPGKASTQKKSTKAATAKTKAKSKRQANLRSAVPGTGIMGGSNFGPLPLAGNNPLSGNAMTDGIGAMLGNLNAEAFLDRPEMAGVLGGGFITLTQLPDGEYSNIMDEDSELPLLHIILPDKMEGEGIAANETGSFNAIAMAEVPAHSEQFLYIQDEEQASSFTVVSNNFSVMRFEGIANLCKISLQNGECSQRLRQTFSGSISFPELRFQKSKLQLVETEDYRAYQQLRVSQISTNITDEMSSGNTNTQATDSGPADNTQSAAEEPQGCDCSCKGYQQMQAFEDAEDIKGMMKMGQCAMQCMAGWMACED